MRWTTVITRLRRACRTAGGQAQWAKQHRVSPAYVSDVLSGRRAPGPKILAPLGLIEIISYRLTVPATVEASK